MLVFNKKDKFVESARFLIESLDFDRDVVVSVSGAGSRLLGGLLSAHLLEERLGLIPGYHGELLGLAEELATRLSAAFRTNSRLPYTLVNLRHGLEDPTLPQITTLGEATALTLEFLYISHLTGNPQFRDIILTTYKALNITAKDNLYGTMFGVHTLATPFQRGAHIGGNSGEFYATLFKVYQVFGDETWLLSFVDSYEILLKHSYMDSWFHDIHFEQRHIRSFE
jgi:hypothetical protein